MAKTEERAEFGIVYDGPALADHVMDVRDLGPALLAIGNLCVEANRVLNGDDSSLSVNVKGTGEGCFNISLQLVYEQVSTLVANPHVASVKELLEWVGLVGTPVGGTIGLSQFLKWKKGRRVSAEEPTSDGQIAITVAGDNNTITIPTQVAALAHDVNVRKASRDITLPLKSDGINEFEVRDETGTTVVSIDDSEVKDGYFDIDLDEVGLTDSPVPPQTFEAILELRAAVFEEHKRWQFMFGGNVIQASILDERFNEGVFKKGERFGVGDSFRDKINLIQIRLPNGKLRNTYEVVEVIEVTPGPKQLDFDM